MFHKLSGLEKVYGKEGGSGGVGEHQDFPSIFFVSLPKNLVGEPFRVSLISGIERFYA